MAGVTLVWAQGTKTTAVGGSAIVTVGATGAADGKAYIWNNITTKKVCASLPFLPDADITIWYLDLQKGHRIHWVLIQED